MCKHCKTNDAKPAAEAGLKLEAGKRYRAFDGTITGPLSAYRPLFPSGDKTAFVDPINHRGYTSTGQHWADQYSLETDAAPWSLKEEWNFETWYKERVGVTVAGARRAGVYDLDLLEEAFNCK